MNQNHHETNKSSQATKQRKRKIFFIFIFFLVTLFFISFSVTSVIIIKSYSLIFAEENYIQLQQQVGLLKSELSRRENEVEELKLQLANLEGESFFANRTLNQDHP